MCRRAPCHRRTYASGVPSVAGPARITVSTPQRRLDVALPGQAPVAELLPELLRHAGEPGGIEAPHREWVLRRADGTPLSAGRGLAVQGVRDGEVLHLAPAAVEWPEVRYDDVAEAVAAGARDRGRAWSTRATSATGRVVAGLLLAGGAGLVLQRGAALDPLAPAAVAGVLLLAAGYTSHRRGDRPGAALLVGFAPPYAALAGAGWAPGRPALLAAVVGWLLASLLGRAALGGSPPPGRDRGALDGGWVAVAAITVGVLAVAVAPVGQASWGVLGTVAVLASVLVCGAGALPAVALRLARLPDPPVTGAGAFPAVARADEVLTGALAGWAVLSVASVAVLVAAGGTGALALAVVTSLALLLRVRAFTAVRHRLPLLVGGVVGMGAAAAVLAGNAPAAMLPAVLGSLAAAALLLVLAFGLHPVPELGRVADGTETLVVLSVVPVAAWALDLYPMIALMITSS